MILWVLVAVAFGTSWSLPDDQTAFDPDTLLDSLTSVQLDELLEEKISFLEVELMKTYEDHLKEHEETLKYLYRNRRSIPTLPTLDENAWHAYVFDTHLYREKLVLRDYTIGKLDGNKVIEDVFPMKLDRINAIYKGLNGFGFTITNGSMASLLVRNTWTRSLTGCSCFEGDTSLGCACCSPGGSRCEGSSTDTCVETGGSLEDCVKAKPKHLQLQSAVAFSYHLKGLNYPFGLQEIVVVANNDTVYFYKLDEHGLQELPSKKGHHTIKVCSEITNLGYGEVHVEQFGEITKKRYLFVFGAGSASDYYYEIRINDDDTLETGFPVQWKATGSLMRVWQTGGQVILALQNGTDLYINELTSDQWGRQIISLRQVLNLPDTVTSWKAYETGFNSYIAAVTPTFVRIYSKRLGEYRSLQDLNPSGGIATFEGVVPVNIPMCRNEVVLLAGAGKVFHTYIWDATSGGYVKTNETTLPETIVPWSLGFADGKSVSTSIPKVILDGETGVYGIDVNTEVLHITDPLWEETDTLATEKLELQEEYNRQKQVMEDVQARLDLAIDAVQEPTVTISGSWTFSAPVIIENSLTTNSFDATNITFANTDATGVTYSWYVDHLANIQNVSDWHQNLALNLDTKESILEDVVNTTSAGKKILGTKVIPSSTITFQTLQAGSATIKQSYDKNGIDFPMDATLVGLVKTDDGRKITGKKTFVNSLGMDTLLTDKLDDISVSNIATLTGNYDVSGTVVFNSLEAGTVNMVPSGTVGGIDVSNAVTLSGPGTLGQVSLVQDLTVTQELLVASVDGVNINDLYTHALTKDNGGTIPGTLQFTNRVDSESLAAQTLSGVSSSSFLSNTVFKDEAATIQGTLTIPSVTADMITVSGMVNAKNFPSSFPLKTSSTLNLGTKTFTNVTFDDLALVPGATLDGLLPENLVDLDTEQTITGNKNIKNDLAVVGNLDATSGYIGGVDFNELFANMSSIMEDASFRGVTFKEPVSVPTITCQGMVFNGVDLLLLSDDIIYSSDLEVEISGEKNFKSQLHISSAGLNIVNEKDYKNVVYKSDTRIINGQKTFKNKITFDTSLSSSGLIDYENMTTLVNSALYLNKPGQVVTESKSFANVVSAASLQVDGKVSEVDFRKVLANTGDQTFTAPQSLSAATFADLEATEIVLSENALVNDVDLSELNKLRMSKTNATSHTGVLTVTGEFDAYTLNAVNVNGLNLADVKENAVKDNEDTVISSNLEFSSLVVSGSIGTIGKSGASSYNISNIDEKAVKLAGTNALVGSTSWASMILNGNANVGGLVSGHDLSAVESDAVFTNVGPQSISGKKTFDEGFNVQGSIITSTTNGLDLSAKLFTRHTEQSIGVPYTFNNIRVSNLKLEDSLDYIKLDFLNDRALKVAADSIQTLILHQNVEVANLQLQSLLNGTNIPDLLLDAVKLSEMDQMVTGPKTFKSNVIFKNIDATTVQGKSLSTHFDHIVRKDTPANLKMTVQGTISAPSVSVDSLDIQGTVDGVDYKTLLQNAVLLSGEQTVLSSMEFDNGLTVVGNVQTVQLNTLPLDELYLTTNTPQTISTNVKFGNSKAEANILAGTVNSDNLAHESENTLKITGGQTVNGAKTLLGTTTVQNNVQVTGSTGSNVTVSFGTAAVSLAAGGEISGAVTFTPGLSVQSLTSSSDQIGTIDLVDLATNAWYFDRSAVLAAPISFSAGAKITGMLRTNNSVDDFMIAAVYASTNYSLSNYVTYNEGIKNQYVEKCPLIMEAHGDTEKSIYEADYFTIDKITPLDSKALASEYVQDGNKSYVVVSFEDCQLSLYHIDPASDSLQESEQSGYGTDWEVFKYSDQIYLVAAAGSDVCGSTNTKVYLLDSNALVEHQTLPQGTTVSKYYVKDSGVLGLSIDGKEESFIYTFNPTTTQFTFVETVNPGLEILATLKDKDGKHVEFRRVNGKGQMFVDGVFLQETDKYMDNVNDANLFEQHGKTYLALSATRDITGIEHRLELYLVKPNGFSWLHSVPLQEPASLTSFYTGNKASGTTMILAVQKNWYPEAYTLLGSELKLFVQLNSPGTGSAQHFCVQDSLLPELCHNYLMLFEGSTKQQLLKLHMNGAAQEMDSLECNPEAFMYPELASVQPVYF